MSLARDVLTKERAREEGHGLLQTFEKYIDQLWNAAVIQETIELRILTRKNWERRRRI
jgi:hypothetical protein